MDAELDLEALETLYWAAVGPHDSIVQEDETARAWQAAWMESHGRIMPAMISARRERDELRARVESLGKTIGWVMASDTGFRFFGLDPVRVKQAEEEVARGETVPWEELRAELEQRAKEKAESDPVRVDVDNETLLRRRITELETAVREARRAALVEAADYADTSGFDLYSQIATELRRRAGGA